MMHDRALPRPDMPPPPAARPGAHRQGMVSPRAQALLEELEELFLDEGFASFTMTALTARLHCSRRTLYELAPNRDELAVVVADRLLRRIGAAATDAAEIEHTRQQQVYTYIHTVALGLGRATLAFSRDVEQTPGVQRVFDAHSVYAIAVLRALIGTAVVEGEFQPVHAGLVAELIHAALQRILDPRLLEAYDLTLSDGLDELARVFSHGLLAAESVANPITQQA